MPRRLFTLAAMLLVLVATLGAGCAEDVAPAARAGDSIVISNDDLMAEAKEWAANPALLDRVGITDPEGAAPGSYSTPFIGVVLTNRIRFDLHREQFDALGLTLSDADTTAVETEVGTILNQADPAFAQRIIDDLARVSAVSNAMGDGYDAWLASSTSTGVEVSSRYGSWDVQAAAVTPPVGPRPAPATDQLVGA